jgi:segregation and condensation protein B
METLALIAYRQPITRGEIEDIRGVSVSSNIIKTLQERDWVKPLGHKEVPGRPTLYGTTRSFLDYFNLKSLNELPTLAEIRDLDQFNPEFSFEDKDEAAANQTDAPDLNA